MDDDIPVGRQVDALGRMFAFRPLLTAGIIVLSVAAAVLEGIGLSFLLPIIDQLRSSGTESVDGGVLMDLFVRTYELLGVPFTLKFIIVGLSVVMILRFTSRFLVEWLRAILRTNYVRHLRSESFDKAMDAEVGYFDTQGSDSVLNSIITESKYAGDTTLHFVKLIEVGSLLVIYLAIAIYLAPMLTIATGVLIGGFIYLFRYAMESGYTVGDKVADANERVQETVQQGVQGILEVKLFGMNRELTGDFRDAINEWCSQTVKLRRNRSAMKNIHELTTAIAVFVLIYVAYRYASLSLGTLGVYLFAMFRFSPHVSRFNDLYYRVEGDLPHLVRSQEFIDELDSVTEPSGDRSPPETVKRVEFDDVSFTYDGTEYALRDVSFGFDQGELIALVGESGAGKSTVVSLLTRMYDVDGGVIRVNGTPIDEFDADEWRSKVAVVRQKPYIFNDTLRYNITIGNREASYEEIEQVCEIARIDKFLPDLPNGFETEVGDDGVRLSGGQRQRIALARALLKDADILLLDEATSDLDTDLEREVQEAITSMEREYTILAIAHRLSTVVDANRIYTLDDGRIIEMGDHEQLLEKGGRYAGLYTAQSEGN